jgi:hypothetical protein
MFAPFVLFGGNNFAVFENEPSPLHFRLRTASPRQVAVPTDENEDEED